MPMEAIIFLPGFIWGFMMGVAVVVVIAAMITWLIWKDMK